jgi:hypothetical protein
LNNVKNNDNNEDNDNGTNAIAVNQQQKPTTTTNGQLGNVEKNVNITKAPTKVVPPPRPTAVPTGATIGTPAKDPAPIVAAKTTIPTASAGEGKSNTHQHGGAGGGAVPQTKPLPHKPPTNTEAAMNVNQADANDESSSSSPPSSSLANQVANPADEIIKSTDVAPPKESKPVVLSTEEAVTPNLSPSHSSSPPSSSPTPLAGASIQPADEDSKAPQEIDDNATTKPAETVSTNNNGQPTLDADSTVPASASSANDQLAPPVTTPTIDGKKAIVNDDKGNTNDDAQNKDDKMKKENDDNNGESAQPIVSIITHPTPVPGLIDPKPGTTTTTSTTTTTPTTTTTATDDKDDKDDGEFVPPDATSSSSDKMTTTKSTSSNKVVAPPTISSSSSPSTISKDTSEDIDVEGSSPAPSATLPTPTTIPPAKQSPTMPLEEKEEPTLPKQDTNDEEPPIGQPVADLSSSPSSSNHV